jgi:hypothetical protein
VVGSELWASIFPTNNWGAKELRISSFPKTDSGASQICVKPTQQIPPPGAHPWPRRMPTGGLERCFSCRRRGYLVLPTRPDPILPKPSWWTHGYRSLSPVFDKMIFAVDTAICHPNKLPNIRVGLECFSFFRLWSFYLILFVCDWFACWLLVDVSLLEVPDIHKTDKTRWCHCLFFFTQLMCIPMNSMMLINIVTIMLTMTMRMSRIWCPHPRQ